VFNKKRVSFFVIVLLLTACGFHLRGKIELQDYLLPLYLQTEGVGFEISRELNALFRANQVNLAESKTEAASVLNIIQAKKSQRVLSIDSNGRVQEYELNYLIRYRLRGKDITSMEKKIHLKRDLLFDPTSVLAVGHEAETLYRDMVSDSARLILQQLQAVAKKAEKSVGQ